MLMKCCHSVLLPSQILDTVKVEAYACSYHFDHLSDGKIFLCEVSGFCERSIVVIACRLCSVWHIGP